MTGISTCSRSLLAPGHCCHFGCARTPTTAVLTADMVEHTWCDFHVDAAAVLEPPGTVQATKPLVWDSVWGPRS